MKKPCGGWDIGDNLKLNGKTLEVGSDNMELSDAGLEVSTGAEGETIAIGCVEDENGDLVNGIRGTDDIHIYAGSGKNIYLNSLILNSSTAGSTKRFKITVNDSGTISATELT